jgi:hypothetical protein
MTDDFDRLPGEPLQHGRNWSPATTFEEYVRNVREGLEAYSDRRAARLLGWPRIAIYRRQADGRASRAAIRSANAA